MKLAKGYWGGRSRLFKTAKEAVMKALASSYRDRRRKKGEFRRLWIARISAGVSMRSASRTSARPRSTRASDTPAAPASRV
jgi:large subunit ribosomal protein L20